MDRSRISPEERQRIAAQAAAERRAMIRAIVDKAPPFSLAQIATLGRIFEGASDRIRARAAQEAAKQEQEVAA